MLDSIFTDFTALNFSAPPRAANARGRKRGLRDRRRRGAADRGGDEVTGPDGVVGPETADPLP